MKELEQYALTELVEGAKDLMSELDWLVRAATGEEYHLRRAQNVADAVADVKAAQKDFNKLLRAYQKNSTF